MYSISIKTINNQQVAEVIAEQIVIYTPEDGLNVLGDLYYQNVDKIVLQLHHFAPTFFDLNTGLLGELLQKFSNYRMQLLIVGDIEPYTLKSKSLNDFVAECNKGNQINFIST